MSKRVNGFVSGLAAVGLAMSGTALAQQQQRGEQQRGTQEQRTQQEDRDKQRGQMGQQQQDQQELSGKIASNQRNKLFLESEQGAIVPFQLGRNTQYEGQRQDGKQVSSAQQLKEGDQVRVSFTSKGAENTAARIELQEEASQELSGKVASTQGDTLYVEYQGALIPLKVNRQTTFEGQNRQGLPIRSARQIQQGDEVRAGFHVQNQTDNVAHRVEVQQSSDQQGQQQPGQQQPGQQRQGSQQEQGTDQPNRGTW